MRWGQRTLQQGGTGLRVCQSHRRYLLLSLGLYALGLMAKPMLVTLPFVLLLLDYWPLGRTRWAEPCSGGLRPPKSALTERRYKTASIDELIWEKLPFLGLAFASCAVTVQVQSRTIRPLASLPMSARVANALVSYVRYIGKTFWPDNLAVFYPYEKWAPWVVVGAGAVLLAIPCAVFWRARREPCLVVGWM